MSVCDSCPKPGSCCKDFVLNFGRHGMRFDADNWWADAKAALERHNLPFEPLRIDPEWKDAPGQVVVRFTCPKVTPEGRCSIYETRPQLCRDYEAGWDRLCVVYVEPMKKDEDQKKDTP